MSDGDLRSRGDPRVHWRFKWRLAASRFAHAFEKVWPALWPPLAVLGLFLAFSLFGFWHFLPAWLHGLGLVAFALVFGWALFQTHSAIIWPSRRDGLERLEEVNELSHQPLRSLDDQLSGGQNDPLTRTLWQRHRKRLIGMIGQLKVGLPKSDLPARDLWALRIGLALVLIVAVVEAGNMAPKRLAQAFDLHRPDAETVDVIQLAVWVTPPKYTGLPAEVLKPGGTAADGLIDLKPSLRFPDGSEVLAQLHHVDGPVERYALSMSDDAEPFVAVGGESAEAKVVLDQSGELSVGDRSDVLGAWQVEVVEDQPPTIAFAAEPAVTQRQVMRFAFEAADDYGVGSIALHLGRPGRPDDVERIELIQPADGATELNDAAYLDLTPHPWSGLSVEVKLEADDGIEQKGFSEVLELVLPTRSFTHPVARAIVEQRRLLADQPEEQREKVAAAMNGLSHVPERFQNDAIVFMALRSMATRLIFDENDVAIDEVLELMWETALHLEDGSLSLAGKELRALQEALRDALANDASDEELQQLMDELRQATNAYLDALAQQQQMTDQAMHPMDQDSMNVERQDLEQMLDRMEDMIETGARDAAQQMLAQMQELLENLQAGDQNGQMEQGQQMLDELQEMIQRQQELLDETFGLSRERRQQSSADRQQQAQQGQQQQGQQQQGQQGQQPGQEGDEDLASQQESLRRALGELMSSLGENGVPIPRAMGEAELSMRQARNALQGGQPGSALDPQTNALDQLRQGGQAMMQEMQQMLGQNPGQGQGQDGMGQQFGQNPTDRDPLGRSMFNRGDADMFGPAVPTELDLGKARSIMEELHRRASQRHRPAQELDYLERLLRRF